jgi:hypothetical protein
MMSVYLCVECFFLIDDMKEKICHYVNRRERGKRPLNVYVFTIKVNVHCVRMLFDLVNVRYRTRIFARVHRTVKVNLVVFFFFSLLYSSCFIIDNFQFLWLYTDNRFEIFPNLKMLSITSLLLI